MVLEQLEHRVDLDHLGEPGLESPMHVSPGEVVSAKLFAASLSARHGERMANGDLRDVVRETYTANAELKQKDVAAMLAISPARVSEFASDIFAKRKEERRAKSLRLTRLGWTQQQVADVLGVDRTTVTKDVQNRQLSDLHIPGDWNEKWLEQEAERLNIPLRLMWAAALEGLNDEARLAKLNIKLQPYDVWQFPRCHDLMGDRHPGRIPGGLRTTPARPR